MELNGASMASMCVRCSSKKVTLIQFVWYLHKTKGEVYEEKDARISVLSCSIQSLNFSKWILARPDLNRNLFLTHGSKKWPYSEVCIFGNGRCQIRSEGLRPTLDSSRPSHPGVFFRIYGSCSPPSSFSFFLPQNLFFSVVKSHMPITLYSNTPILLQLSRV